MPATNPNTFSDPRTSIQPGCRGDAPPPYQHYRRGLNAPGGNPSDQLKERSAMTRDYDDARTPHAYREGGTDTGNPGIRSAGGGSALNTAVSLIGGAVVGAGLMYLFDPDNGPDRREGLGETLGDAAHSAGNALTGAGKVAAAGTAASARSVAGGAGSVWETIADKARDLADSIGGSSSKSSVGLPLFSRRADRSWGDRVGSGWGTAKAAVGLGKRDEWESDEDDTSPVTAPVAGIGVLGAVLAGTLVAYTMLDPQKRRTALQSVARAGEAARGLGAKLGVGGRQQQGGARAATQTEYATSDDFMEPEVGRSMPGVDPSAGATGAPESFRPQGT